jgi:hypothetical protein
METPIHASNDVDRNENLPRIVAAVAGVALVVIAVLVASYSGLWSPPATHVAAQTTTTH